MVSGVGQGIGVLDGSPHVAICVLKIPYNPNVAIWGSGSGRPEDDFLPIGVLASNGKGQIFWRGDQTAKCYI